MQYETQFTENDELLKQQEKDLKSENSNQSFKYFWVVTLLIISFSAFIKIPTFNLSHKEGDEVAFWYLTKNWIDTQKYTLKGSILAKTPTYFERANREMPVHPPMFAFLLKPFVQHNSLKYSVLVSWLGHLMTILAVALIGRWLIQRLQLNDQVNGLSPLFWMPLLGVATDPIMTYISGILWIDNLHAGFAALSVAFSLIATSSNKKLPFYFLSGVFLGFALLSKVTSIMIVPVLLFIIFLFEKNKLWKPLLAGAIPALMMSLPWYIPLYQTTGDVLMHQGAKPEAYQKALEKMQPQQLKEFQKKTRCEFCEAGQATPWYYLWVKLPLINPLVFLTLFFYGLFFYKLKTTNEKLESKHWLIPLFWFLWVMLVATIVHVYIHRRITILVASIYFMLFVLMVLSEKYKQLKLYQPHLLFSAMLCIIYSAMTGVFYLFHAGYAEIYSLPELAGVVNLWGAQ
ncbi:MAG: hypothetical protein COW84_09960 [Gammaproteobacteria bacterium CG22_combo_CG10-13_8_21_14_all_40_8]|nr:MAG: hypothetical protein COW84_09960 [Gammaproteobacteria bacterium CG22_combo_CG10-13_8_21_14_all_40_8]